MRLGVLPLVFFVLLVPLLTPIIQQFWPTSTVWWSAVLVSVLGAALSAVWLVYGKQLNKAGLSGPTPSAAPMPMDGAPKPQRQSAMKTWLLG